jgi:hypothetical protein
MILIHKYTALALALTLSGKIAAQDFELPPDLADLSLEDVSKSLIAFVNFAATPGIEGATFRIDEPTRDSYLRRSSLGFATDIAVRDHVFDGYWGAALSYAHQDDDILVLDSNAAPRQVDVDRKILSLSGSVGLSLPLDQYFRLRPYLTVAVSRLETDSAMDEFSEPVDLPRAMLENKVNALTTSLTLEADYDRWFADRRLQLGGHYTAGYTDTFDASHNSFDTWGWAGTAVLRSRFSADTGWRTRGRSWRWAVYADHTRLQDLERAALGFTYYTEIGFGFDYEVSIRPLDWYGQRFLGIEAGYIFGNGVHGYAVSLTF